MRPAILQCKPGFSVYAEVGTVQLYRGTGTRYIIKIVRRYQHTKMNCTAVRLLSVLPDALAVAQYSRPAASYFWVLFISSVRRNAYRHTVVATKIIQNVLRSSRQRDYIVTSSLCSDMSFDGVVAKFVSAFANKYIAIKLTLNSS